MQKLLLLYYVVKSTDYVPFEEAKTASKSQKLFVVVLVLSNTQNMTSSRYFVKNGKEIMAHT